MKVIELFKQLSESELSNLSLANDGDGTIQTPKHGRVLNAINDGLGRLFDRFNLLEKDCIIKCYPHITFYHLHSKYAKSNAPEAGAYYGYIQDTPADPFLDDPIRILGVYNGHGEELTLNDDEDEESFFTPKPLVLQVPKPAETELICVRYQAQHPLVQTVDDEIDIPRSLQEALRAFIAYKIYTQINTQEAKAMASEHMQNYEALCAIVLEQDLVNSSRSTTNIRFGKGGWK